MTTIIRSPKPGDEPAIFDLVADFATSFRPDAAAFQKSFHSLLRDESAAVIVAEQNGAVVGYCLGFEHLTFYANGRVAWLEEIMVRAEFRRKKVGHLLMENFESWARQKQARLVGLATRRAAPFYGAIGYEESALFFRKLLSGGDRA